MNWKCLFLAGQPIPSEAEDDDIDVNVQNSLQPSVKTDNAEDGSSGNSDSDEAEPSNEEINDSFADATEEEDGQDELLGNMDQSERPLEEFDDASSQQLEEMEDFTAGHEQSQEQPDEE